MQARWGGLCAAAALLLPMAAGAHELGCEKTVDGKAYEEVSYYPTTLHYRLVTKNTHPTSASDVLSAVDPLFDQLHLDYSAAQVSTLPLGGSASAEVALEVGSYEECEWLAKADGYDDHIIDNTFTVTWDSGSTTCRATVKCKRPDYKPPSYATRTLGFYKTHIDAVDQCLAGGAIDVGVAEVDTRAEALGILWSATNRFDDGKRRQGLDQKRIIAARQLLAGICNSRLFGSSPTPASLFADALAAIKGRDCAAIGDLGGKLDDFNNSGDNVGFPSGFSPGPATPQSARQQADDPTTPSGEVCR